MIGERFVGGLVILLLLPDLSLARNLPASKEMLILSIPTLVGGQIEEIQVKVSPDSPMFFYDNGEVNILAPAEPARSSDNSVRITRVGVAYEWEEDRTVESYDD